MHGTYPVRPDPDGLLRIMALLLFRLQALRIHSVQWAYEWDRPDLLRRLVRVRQYLDLWL